MESYREGRGGGGGTTDGQTGMGVPTRIFSMDGYILKLHNAASNNPMK